MDYDELLNVNKSPRPNLASQNQFKCQTKFRRQITSVICLHCLGSLISRKNISHNNNHNKYRQLFVLIINNTALNLREF